MGTMLLYGDSYRNPNIYYATGFIAPDPFIYVRAEGRDVLAVPAMEKSRAQKEARVGQVMSYEDLGYQSAVDETGNSTLALAA
ncbi:MAG TPA: aminopeptidase P family N-terminal domain-containing protein, partial [Chloroflexota bacterium]|nr:aminopeptidase P family N-terminal domain-containing protein [Chloroflexota bacterium]